MATLITRAEYMADSSNLHHAYYLQFATRATFAIVLARIGRSAIAESTDPHMNDIPLCRWDALNESIRSSIRQRVKGQAEGYPAGRFSWSLSDAVCIAKAVAREIKAGREFHE